MTAFLSLLIVTALYSPIVERAFTSLEDGDYDRAAALLDESAAIEPEYFERNNLPYLRGIIAVQLEDWARADAEFARIGEQSVLRPISLFHRASVAVETRRDDEAIAFIDRLPSGFPASLRMELAGRASPRVALHIYDAVNTREAQARRAAMRSDTPTLWELLRRRTNDDISLDIAVRLHEANPDPTSDQRILLARTLHGHRDFARAAALYGSLLEDGEFGPEAHYELGRTYFQQTLYDEAIEVFGRTARRFPGTDWEQDSEVQIASSYWRKLDFVAAEATYLGLIEKYDDPDNFQEFVRDLVDIYRSLERTPEALEWTEQGLDRDPRASTRAVLTFTRGKILYHEGRFEEALTDFQQLGSMSLRSVPNGTDRDEVRFLEALVLERLGRGDEAQQIWNDLASDPLTYYGLHSLDRLTDSDREETSLQQDVWEAIASGSIDLCSRGFDSAAEATIQSRSLQSARGFRTEDTPESGLVGELLFLRQWNEAFFWARLGASMWRDEQLADFAFAAGEFRPAMLYADRIRPPDDELFSYVGSYDDEARVLMGMLYPAAYPEVLCRESEDAGVDPLWLRSIIYQESRYDPSARSGSPARGLMQFIPETATAVADRIGLGEMTPDRMYTAEVSIRLGAHYWAELMEEFGSAEYALAAYNGGPHNVRRWASKSRDDDPMLFLSDIGFVQTKNYVSQIFGLYAKYLHLQ